jgi:NADH:ubiquinone oxidoreductase subunit F (NADH-binding)
MTGPMAAGNAQRRLFDGRPLPAGPEPLAEHMARLGPLPSRRERKDVLPALEASELLGRGGGGFPVGRKWRSVAERSGGRAVVLANGAEGEPLSAKDRAVMTLRPHAVLDGALLAADAVGADEVILYLGSAHRAARRSMTDALGQRVVPVPVRIVAAPDRYIAGEESAAVHFVNQGDARPTASPARPYERGVAGRPTLVQNVESLAYAGLIARFGPDWYRGESAAGPGGIGLMTLAGVAHPGVREIELGTPLGQVISQSGARQGETRAVLLGGYFGRWVAMPDAWPTALEPAALRAAGLTFGCGVVSVLGPDGCGVSQTSAILDYLAEQSAAQCGPCVFGLRAIADATARLASRSAASDDLVRIERWAGQLAGRGACRHPDGAAGLLQSALEAFGDEWNRHARSRTCSGGEPSARAA